MKHTLLILLYVGLAAALFSRSPGCASSVSWVLYSANLVIVLHVCLGIYVMLYRIAPVGGFAHMLHDVALIAALFASVLFLPGLFRWSLAYALFFTLVVLKYLVLSRSTKDERVKAYAQVKIRCELCAVPFFLLVAVLAYRFAGDVWVVRGLEVTALMGGIAFAVWLIFVKKTYARVLTDGLSPEGATA